MDTLIFSFFLLSLLVVIYLYPNIYCSGTILINFLLDFLCIYKAIHIFAYYLKIMPLYIGTLTFFNSAGSLADGSGMLTFPIQLVQLHDPGGDGGVSRNGGNSGVSGGTQGFSAHIIMKNNPDGTRTFLLEPSEVSKVFYVFCIFINFIYIFICSLFYHFGFFWGEENFCLQSVKLEVLNCSVDFLFCHE